MSDNSSSYGRIRERLEEIVVQIRSKDVPLEKSLDLYEEALRLGGIAAEMIDKTDFTEDEIAAVDALYEDGPAGSGDGLPDDNEAVSSSLLQDAGSDNEPNGQTAQENPETTALEEADKDVAESAAADYEEEA